MSEIKHKTRTFIFDNLYHFDIILIKYRQLNAAICIIYITENMLCRPCCYWTTFHSSLFISVKGFNTQKNSLYIQLRDSFMVTKQKGQDYSDRDVTTVKGT